MTITLAEFKQNTQMSGDPFVMTNNQGVVLEINHYFERVFGWTATEIIGKHIGIILPVTFRDAHNLGFSRFTATEISTILNHPLTLKTLAKSGQEIISEHYIMAEKLDNQWFFAARLRPLPEEAL